MRFPAVIGGVMTGLLIAGAIRVQGRGHGSIARVYQIKAKPGRMEEYNRYIREVAAPIEEEARKHGAFVSLTTLVSRKAESPWTNLQIFEFRDHAQLESFDRAMDAAKERLEPEAARRKTRDAYAATLRDFVGEEVFDVLK